MTSLPPEQRARLVGAKFSSLIASHSGLHPEVTGFPGGAAALVEGTAWVFLDDRPATGLGGALAWAMRHEATSLAVVAGTDTSLLARRAAAFAFPVTVWQVAGTDLQPAEVAPIPSETPVDPAELAAAATLADVGVEVVIEHGVVTGEVRGLEVARVVTVNGAVEVHPGVGRNDRDGHAMLLGSDGDATQGGAARTALERVAADIRRLRSGVEADRHPLGRMARSRWLRHEVVVHPDLVGAVTLEPVPGTVERTSVGDDGGAFAVGHDAAGSAVVVGCSVGVDLDLVPAAADVRLVADARSGSSSRLVLVLPTRDDLAVTRRLAALLGAPATIVTVPDDWYTATGALRGG